MFKSILYLSLYGAIAGAGWFIYSAMDSDEKPMAEIQQRIDTLTEKLTMGDNKTIYRWQDERGRWVYGNEIPENIAKKQAAIEEYDYQKELELLKSLPKEALPVQSENLGVEEREKSGLGFTIPGIPSLDQVSKLLEEATSIENKHQQRLDNIDGATSR